jgi:hypothetical protein
MTADCFDKVWGSLLCAALLLQFLVTRNPSFLQPDAAVAAQQQQGARDSMRRSRHSSSSNIKGAGWWVSAGALFAGVSAVLALAVCYMSAQIWSRYKVREALEANTVCVSLRAATALVCGLEVALLRFCVCRVPRSSC